MNTSFDLYAETNPAFCAAVLAEFCESFRDRIDASPSMIIAYPVLPIAMSEDMAPSFAGTNVNTGFAVWLYRSPWVLEGLAQRVNTTLAITTDAIKFGCLAHLLHLGEDGLLSSQSRKIPKTRTDGTNNPAFGRARSLGAWIAGAGSLRAVMEGFGVSV
ncbi:hypothetical protein R69608_03209 [Paraburkholderia nemoris]|uniref:three component ABC system middle component n=1 Tax=Paraburkholderia nemoris TaxID=2793076 RepID=UPI001911AE01|nr:three component ABC system middle component [Paraburkholderia nemoris]MBK5148534.1 hypothetical protein [Burkholderia sp. R-69608]CAE6905959.1 hypothetical protein R69608_03209 [Paraburkholderia nemoris]